MQTGLFGQDAPVKHSPPWSRNFAAGCTRSRPRVAPHLRSAGRYGTIAAANRASSAEWAKLIAAGLGGISPEKVDCASQIARRVPVAAGRAAVQS